tara:strand:+ start:1856 stop:2095 length:240 start_codon:yes stop_codon:yes gene_type:complete
VTSLNFLLSSENTTNKYGSNNLVAINARKNINGCIIPTVLEIPSIPYRVMIEKYIIAYVKNAGSIDGTISNPEYLKTVL